MINRRRDLLGGHICPIILAEDGGTRIGSEDKEAQRTQYFLKRRSPFMPILSVSIFTTFLLLSKGWDSLASFSSAIHGREADHEVNGSRTLSASPGNTPRAMQEHDSQGAPVLDLEAFGTPMVEGQVRKCCLGFHTFIALGSIHSPFTHRQLNALVIKPASMTLPEFASYNWISLDEDSLPESGSTDCHSILHRLFVMYKPVLILTLGNAQQFSKGAIMTMPYNFRRLWVHYNDSRALSESDLTLALLMRADMELEAERPLMSVVTSSFRSGEKIQRAYQSLVAQSYDYWEWILWDDSPETETYEMLLKLAAKDMRLRVFKAPQRSGSIGEMKFRASSLALGEWLVELDHDDRISTNLFAHINDITNRYPTTKFIYSDHVELHEEEDGPFNYGQYYAYFYGSYMRQHIRSYEGGPLQPHYISRGAWANPITLRHLIGLPNHVRIWKRTFYETIGRHRVVLNVADDYDLLIRTFLQASPGEIVCLAAPSYFQYRNKGANNFTFMRNALIQHLVHHLYQTFHGAMLAKYRALGWKEEYPYPGRGIWETSLPDVSPRMEVYYVPEDQDPGYPCVSIILPVASNAEGLLTALETIILQTHTNWKVFIIGDGCPRLDDIAIADFPRMFPSHLDKLLWYNLESYHRDDFVTAKNYALRMLVKTQWVTYMGQHDKWEPHTLESMLHHCRNQSLCFQSGQDPDKISVWSNADPVLHNRALSDRYGFWEFDDHGSNGTSGKACFAKRSQEP